VYMRAPSASLSVAATWSCSDPRTYSAAATDVHRPTARLTSCSRLGSDCSRRLCRRGGLHPYPRRDRSTATCTPASAARERPAEPGRVLRIVRLHRPFMCVPVWACSRRSPRTLAKSLVRRGDEVCVSQAARSHSPRVACTCVAGDTGILHIGGRDVRRVG
jgi:hypothetical protein